MAEEPAGQVPNDSSAPSAPSTPATQSSSSVSASSNTFMAVLCYFGILVLIPLLTDAKNDPFVKFHIKQGLALLIGYIVASFIFWIPVIGWLLGIVMFVLFLIGVINAAGGKQSPLPILGSLGEKIKI